MDLASERTLVRSPGPTQIRWGALFASAFVTFGIWALLMSLGMALGLSGIDPNDPSSLKGAGIFSGIWGLIAPLVALFLGGWFAARTSGILDRTSGILHGVALWGFTTVAGAWLVVSLVGALVGGAVSATANVARGAGSAASSVIEKQSPGQTQATGRQLSQQLGQAKSQVEQAGPQIAQGATAAAHQSGAAFWGVFGVLALGLVSSVLGALTGTSLLHRHTAAMEKNRPIPVERQVLP